MIFTVSGYQIRKANFFNLNINDNINGRISLLISILMAEYQNEQEVGDDLNVCVLEPPPIS